MTILLAHAPTVEVEIIPAPAANPRDAWPVWTDADRWVADEPSTPDDEPRPTPDTGHEPNATADAYWAGYCLGLDREDAAAPGHYAPGEARAFLAGHAAGSREWERRLDEMFADRMADGRIADADGYAPGYYS